MWVLFSVMWILALAVKQHGCTESEGNTCSQNLHGFLVDNKLDVLASHEGFLDIVDSPADFEHIEEGDISGLDLDEEVRRKLEVVIEGLKEEKEQKIREKEEAEAKKKKKAGWQWGDYHNKCEACRVVVEQVLGRVADVLYDG